MPKKILISTLLLLAGWNLAIALPANAKEVTIDGTKYWTMDEVLKESEKYQQIKTICNENRECEMHLETVYFLAGGVYSASASFSNIYFMITAVDPENSTIKVLFQDKATDDFIENRKIDTLKNIYLFWWENGEPKIQREIYTGKISNPNRREIYTYKAKEEEQFPGNTEVEITVPKAVIEILKTRPIYWGVESKLSNAFSSGRHFESCLTEIEGKRNYECRAVFDELANIRYYPAEKISTSTMRVPEVVPEAMSDTTPELPTKTITEVVTKTVPEVSIEKVIETVTETAPKEHVEVPLAAKNDEKEHEFPWWFIVFAFSGIFLILWWFIPTKKVQKNS